MGKRQGVGLKKVRAGIHKHIAPEYDTGLAPADCVGKRYRQQAEFNFRCPPELNGKIGRCIKRLSYRNMVILEFEGMTRKEWNEDNTELIDVPLTREMCYVFLEEV